MIQKNYFYMRVNKILKRWIYGFEAITYLIRFYVLVQLVLYRINDEKALQWIKKYEYINE